MSDFLGQVWRLDRRDDVAIEMLWNVAMGLARRYLRERERLTIWVASHRWVTA